MLCENCVSNEAAVRLELAFSDNPLAFNEQIRKQPGIFDVDRLVAIIDGKFNLRVCALLQAAVGHKAAEPETLSRLDGFLSNIARAVSINGGAIQLYRNQILTNGAASTAQAIVILSGAGSIHTNGIASGSAGNTWGILFNSNTPFDIYNNLIIAEQATAGTATGLQFMTLSTGSSIFNNIILGNPSSPQSYCMRENVALPGTVDIDSNNLLNCPSGLMEDQAGVTYSTICNAGVPSNTGTFGDAACGATYPNGNAQNNISIDPVFNNAASGDFRYSPSSPCLSAQGGVDPTVYGATVFPDVDFVQRPGADGSFSIGPYEPTQGCL